MYSQQINKMAKSIIFSMQSPQEKTIEPHFINIVITVYAHYVKLPSDFIFEKDTN